MKQKIQENERDILIDGYPCFKEFRIQLHGIPEFGELPASARVYFPLFDTIPLSTYAHFLFQSGGSSAKDSEYYYALVRVYLALGGIVSLPTGKNRYWNQSFMKFRDNTLIYKHALNVIPIERSSRKIKNNSYDLDKNEKETLKQKIKNKIIAGQRAEGYDDFPQLFRKAVYEELKSVLMTPLGFENFKAEITSRINEFSENTVKNKSGLSETELLKILKDVITYEHTQALDKNSMRNILASVNLIFEQIAWYETQTGAVIFIDPIKKMPDFLIRIHETLDQLKDLLLNYEASKKPGLKKKVKEWLLIIEGFQSSEEVIDQSLPWIRNTFCDKTAALQRIAIEGKIYYNKLLSLFCRHALRLINENEYLSQYEIRLFISMNFAHKYLDYHNLLREPIFYNFIQFNEYAIYVYLLSLAKPQDQRIKELLLQELIIWLKFFPLWKYLVRSEDLEEKTEKRKKKKVTNQPDEEKFIEPTVVINDYQKEWVQEEYETEMQKNVPDDLEEFPGNEIDFENSDDKPEPSEGGFNELSYPSEESMMEEVVGILTKHGKPIHAEAVLSKYKYGNLGRFAREKNFSRQYANKIINEAFVIIKKHSDSLF